MHDLIVGIRQEMVYEVRNGPDYGLDVDNADPENFVLRIGDHTWGKDDMCEDFFDYIDPEGRMIHLEFSPQFVGMSDVMSEDDDL